MQRHPFEHELAGPAVSPRRTSAGEHDEWAGESLLPPLAGPACRHFSFAPEPGEEEEGEHLTSALDQDRISDEVVGAAVVGESVVPDDHPVDEDPWSDGDSAGFEAAEPEEDRAEIIAMPTPDTAPWAAEREDERGGEPTEEVFAFVDDGEAKEEERSRGEGAEALTEAGAQDVLDGIADRLEGVADRLRSSSLDEILRTSGDDPLALLLTGFVLGASQRRSED